jgi:hypothetical protein
MAQLMVDDVQLMVRIFTDTSCPRCRARRKTACFVEGPQATITCHAERRKLWKAKRERTGNQCTCGHHAIRHRAQRNGERGCERCACERTIEDVAANPQLSEVTRTNLRGPATVSCLCGHTANNHDLAERFISGCRRCNCARTAQDVRADLEPPALT